MKSWEKELLNIFLDAEDDVIEQLRVVYELAEKDILKNIENLLSRRDANMQWVIYQIDYQAMLQKQINAILDQLYYGEFDTIAQYITECYENGFLGALYSIQQQGMPFIFPINQKAVANAVQLDSKLSEGLYKRLGEDVTVLKKKIRAQISRGIATGKSYDEIATLIMSDTKVPYNNAIRIARTEGHRVQIQASVDGMNKAKAEGADIVKQWDSTMDGETRPAHRQVDGEIREMDEPFSNGLMYPSDPNGEAGEVINCRCVLLQRCRSALDAEELETLKERAAFWGLDKTKSFEEYKEKYLKAIN